MRKELCWLCGLLVCGLSMVFLGCDDDDAEVEECATADDCKEIAEPGQTLICVEGQCVATDAGVGSGGAGGGSTGGSGGTTGGQTGEADSAVGGADGGPDSAVGGSEVDSGADAAAGSGGGGELPDDFGAACTDGNECTSGTCDWRRCTGACDDEHLCPDDAHATCEEGMCKFQFAPPLANPPKVGFLYIGPVGDHGWTKTHNDARLFLEEHIDGIETVFAPSVNVADVPGVIEGWLDEGVNVFIGTSFDMLVPVQAASSQNPDLNFLICSGFVATPNLGSYFGRAYQALWLAGRLAGHMTVTNRIGVVGAKVIPETVRHLNAFTLGAHSVNPEVEVMIRWVFDWFNPPAEQEATEELVSFGADIIYSGTDTPTAIDVSKDMVTDAGDPVYSIGHDNADTCRFAPDRCLTSTYFNWGPQVQGIIEHMMGGTWDPSDLLFDNLIESRDLSTVHIAEINALVPDQIVDDVEGFIPLIASGQHNVFEGPVVDNTGTVRADGNAMSDEDLLGMCWYVEGVFEPAEGDLVPAVVPEQCPGAH